MTKASTTRNGKAYGTAERDLKARTKAFALRVIRLTRSMPRGVAEDVMVRQLMRSATSVAANFRAACRARSSAEFLAKLGIVEEEADESALWLELMIESGIMDRTRLDDLLTEAHQLTAIVVASIKTARQNAS